MLITILIITHLVMLATGFTLAAVMAAGKHADCPYSDGTYGNEKH